MKKLRTLAPIGLLLLAFAAYADTALYDLDAQNAKEIAEAIQSVLAAQCTAGPTPNPVTNQSMCHAELLPTGQLLIEAPASSQSQIAAVLKSIAARDAGPTPRVTLQYWVISGTPGMPNSADAALRPLSGVLEQLERLHGDLGFAVEDSVSLSTQSGTLGLSGGGPFEIAQNVRANGDALSGSLKIAFHEPQISQNLSIDVGMKRGEYLVLGERTFREDERSGLLFYVVHWPVAQ
jgi:hypothetical protein